jgi:hypothetical protein
MSEFKMPNMEELMRPVRLHDLPHIPIGPSPAILAMAKMGDIAERNLATQFYDYLVEWINDFDSKLDQAHEVGVRLVNFGQSITFHLEAMGAQNPSLISFSGKLQDGSPVELIQHVTQISILLMKVPRLNPDEPKVKFGFHTPEDEAPSA